MLRQGGLAVLLPLMWQVHRVQEGENLLRVHRCFLYIHTITHVLHGKIRSSADQMREEHTITAREIRQDEALKRGLDRRQNTREEQKLCV